MANIILTGVDNSETAFRAAEKAATLAANLGAELHVLSAFDMTMTQSVQSIQSKHEPAEAVEAYKTLVVKSAEEAERIASTVADRLRINFPTLRVISRAMRGAPGITLVNAANEIDADVIVVGNRRVQGPARVLGSIARTVASESPCDLYVVHTHQRRV